MRPPSSWRKTDLVQAAKRLATAGTGDDIEALVILVMMEAAEDAAEDLKALMEQMRSTNAAKRGMRELICKVASDVAENIGRPDGGKLVFKGGGLGGEAEYHRAPGALTEPGVRGGRADGRHRPPSRQDPDARHSSRRFTRRSRGGSTA